MTSITFASLAAASIALLGGAPAVARAQGSCSGADSGIVSVRTLPPVTDATGVSTFRVAVTVANVGTAKQAGNTLESVAMYEHGVRTDLKGLQPLAAGARETVVFSMRRSADAGAGSTNLQFVLKFARPTHDCNTANDRANATL
jgi:hypothetical protein